MDEQEFTRLAELYSRLVFHVAFCHVKNRADADDIMQDVFFALYTDEKSFRDDEHVKAWLVRVTVNKCINLMRSNSRRQALPLEAAENVGVQQAQSDGLLPVIMQLKPKYRLVLYMYYYEEYSVGEIAKMLRENVSAVTTRLSRGRKQLRELLLKEGYDGL